MFYIMILNVRYEKFMKMKFLILQGKSLTHTNLLILYFKEILTECQIH